MADTHVNAFKQTVKDELVKVHEALSNVDVALDNLYGKLSETDTPEVTAPVETPGAKKVEVKDDSTK